MGCNLTTLGKADRSENYLYKSTKEGRLEPDVCLRFGCERLVRSATHAVDVGVGLKPSYHNSVTRHRG